MYIAGLTDHCMLALFPDCVLLFSNDSVRIQSCKIIRSPTGAGGVHQDLLFEKLVEEAYM